MVTLKTGWSRSPRIDVTPLTHRYSSQRPVRINPAVIDHLASNANNPPAMPLANSFAAQYWAGI
jgi:hypothetical protein